MSSCICFGGAVTDFAAIFVVAHREADMTTMGTGILAVLVSLQRAEKGFNPASSAPGGALQWLSGTLIQAFGPVDVPGDAQSLANVGLPTDHKLTVPVFLLAPHLPNFVRVSKVFSSCS